jgi:crotonobetainyl-CoA:carnitine CoA-transferase CaiB-like acyl-CoA transferase
MSGPLDDIRVLDLSQFVAGPYATLLLSFLGAEIIKIEPPGRGDRFRTLCRPSGAAMGVPFAMMNSNKRSVTLNLREREGQEILKRLVGRIDLLVENFGVGVMARWGLGYEQLSAINQRLIYATATGYGLKGPYAQLPALDPVVQAMGGVIAATGEPSATPTRIGPIMADYLGAAHFTAAILAAIRQRDRTGKGLIVELSLHDAIVPTLTIHAGGYYGLGRTQLRYGNREPGGAFGPANVYPASDGYIFILVDSTESWQRLCGVMQRTELADDERCKTLEARIEHQDELDAVIAKWTRTFSKQAVMDLLKPAHILCGIVKELPEVMTDSHLHERGMLCDIEHPQAGRVTVPTSPLRLEARPSTISAPAPALGADNTSFYKKELGLSETELEDLHKRGII